MPVAGSSRMMDESDDGNCLTIRYGHQGERKLLKN